MQRARLIPPPSDGSSRLVLNHLILYHQILYHQILNHLVLYHLIPNHLIQESVAPPSPRNRHRTHHGGVARRAIVT